LHTVLLATIQEFIATAEPVGSHQIVRRYPLGVRAAMVRNLMAELEETGYLQQPHTSAGRIPTDKAFRHYVDGVIARRRIGFEDRAQIELHYSEHNRPGDIEETMRDTSRLLALLTGQAALVMPPRLEALSLESVNFVRLREGQALAVFVTTAGGMHSRLIETDNDHSQTELDRMANYLNDCLHGRTLDEARTWIELELKRERARYDRFVHSALVMGELAATRRRTVELYIDGSSHVLEQPEFTDRARLRELLRALEDKTSLLDLLERSLKQSEPMVLIGAENLDLRLSGFSVVAACYQSGSTPLGSLAIVGPVRMDYQRVIPLVEYTARALSRILEH
ncbi:MAG: heat-inducible transcriptional repressor HrcA, partial [Candidatus Binataceae bacterium]